MTLQVNGFDNTPFVADKHASAAGDRFIKTYLRVTFTGTYVTGGDTLDLSNTNGASTSFPNTIPPAVSSLVGIAVVPRGPAAGFTGLGGICIVIPTNTDAPITFADALLLKLKLLVSVGTEFASAGVYTGTTGITGDEIILECTWAR